MGMKHAMNPGHGSPIDLLGITLTINLPFSLPFPAHGFTLPLAIRGSRLVS
jgi:hypothetical protein